MSVELLPTLEKDVVSKNKTSSDKKADPKKEGGSLFDSLIKNVEKQAPEHQKSTTNVPQKKYDKNQDISNKQQPQVATASKNIEDQETPIKKMVNSLVEIVVEQSKEQNATTKTDTKNVSKTKKLLVVEEEPKVKENIEKNVTAVKQSAKELGEVLKVQKDVKKTEIVTDGKISAKLGSEKKVPEKIDSEKKVDIFAKVEKKVDEIEKATKSIVKEIEKVVSKEEIKTDTQEVIESKSEKATVESLQSQSDENKSSLKQKVEQKVEVITKATKEIKEDISTKKAVVTDEKSDITQQVQVTTNISTQELADKIEQKVEIITSAADDIQKEVSKVVFVSSDQLIKKIHEFKNEENSSIEKKKIVIISSQNTQSKSSDDLQLSDKNAVLSNSFLMAQQKEKQQVSMKNIHDAKKNIEEKQTLEAVKKSANSLELNPDEIEVEQVGEKGEAKSELFAKHEKQVQEQFLQNKFLNKMVIDQQTQKEVITEELEKQTVESKSTQGAEKSSTEQKEATVNLNVPSSVAETIQSKIIGAHQRVGSYMSEVARNMYLNYKPPFTSFRMNLNPANLGTISIVMRANNSDSNLSVSMNMSSNATMDSFVENRAALQSALQRQLGEGSNVTLNFGMQSGNDSQSFDSNMNQSQNNSSSNSHNNENEAIVQNTVEQEEVSETLNYM